MRIGDTYIEIINAFEVFPDKALGKLHALVAGFQGEYEVRRGGVWAEYDEEDLQRADLFVMDLPYVHVAGWADVTSECTSCGQDICPTVLTRRVPRARWRRSVAFLEHYPVVSEKALEQIEAHGLTGMARSKSSATHA